MKGQVGETDDILDCPRSRPRDKDLNALLIWEMNPKTTVRA